MSTQLHAPSQAPKSTDFYQWAIKYGLRMRIRFKCSKAVTKEWPGQEHRDHKTLSGQSSEAKAYGFILC